MIFVWMHEESLLVRRRMLDVVDSKHHKCRKRDEDDDPFDGAFAEVQGSDAPEELRNATRGHQPRTNKVAKEHAQLYIDQARSLPMLKPLDKNVMYNSRAELQVKRPVILSNGDTFKIGDTIFKYEERD